MMKVKAQYFLCVICNYHSEIDEDTVTFLCKKKEVWRCGVSWNFSVKLEANKPSSEGHRFRDGGGGEVLENAEKLQSNINIG